jgi:hypothetical protein
MRTFDNRGRLLGDDTLPSDLQSMVDEAGASTDPNVVQLPEMTVTAAAEPAFDFSSLLEPPMLYVLIAAVALAAYLLEEGE